MAHNSRHIRVGCVPPNLPRNSHYSPALLHLTTKPLIETNFQYNRTTNNMTDATKSYVVDSFFPSFRFVYLAPKSVTFYERSFVLPHCASAATQFGQVPLFFCWFYLRFSPSPSSYTPFDKLLLS